MRYALLFLAPFSVMASQYDELDGGYPSGRYDQSYDLSPPRSLVDGVYGSGRAVAPEVVIPAQPGSGASYIGPSQIMTDHQYCFRSAVSGAMICHSH